MPQPIPITWNGTDAQGNPLRWNQPGLTWNGLVPEPQTKPKKMPQLRVQLGFTNAPDHSVVERTDDVLGGLYVSDLWNPLPAGLSFPVAQADLLTARTDFSDSVAAADMGGPADTADKNNKRDVLVGLLRRLASFVQDHHGNDMAKLLASGFEAVSTNRAPQPLDKPVIRDIVHAGVGRQTLRVGPVANTKNYRLRYALLGAGGAPGPWQDGGLFSNSQQILATGLPPGAEHIFQVQAIGGSTGQSDWSDSRSARSM